MTTRTQLRLLVVDDCDDEGLRLAEGLRMLGHQVVVAADGRAALELASDELDAAFVDVAMPEASGLAIARDVRRRGLALRLIAFTAAGMQAECTAAGFDAFALKPVSLDDLISLTAPIVPS